MKFRELIEVNRSPKIEQMILYKDNIFMNTSDSIYSWNINTNTLEEVEFIKKT